MKTIVRKRQLGKRPANPDMATSSSPEYRKQLEECNRTGVCLFCPEGNPFDGRDPVHEGKYWNMWGHSFDPKKDEKHRTVIVLKKGTEKHIEDYPSLMQMGWGGRAMHELFRIAAHESQQYRRFGRIFWSREGDMDDSNATLAHQHAQTQEGDSLTDEVKVNLGRTPPGTEETPAIRFVFEHHVFEDDVPPVRDKHEHRMHGWRVYFVQNESHPTLPFYFVFEQVGTDARLYRHVTEQMATDLLEAICWVVEAFNIPGSALLMREAITENGGEKLQPQLWPTHNYPRISAIFPPLG